MYSIRMPKLFGDMLCYIIFSLLVHASEFVTDDGQFVSDTGAVIIFSEHSTLFDSIIEATGNMFLGFHVFASSCLLPNINLFPQMSF